VKLFVYRHPSGVRNFGDELGRNIFPALLPGRFDEDGCEIFLGIGSILFDSLPPTARKIVLGAGYGGYTRPPVIDATWTIHGVRGPMTCRALGLEPRLAIGDPAMLLRVMHPRRSAPKRLRTAFMPHWQSMQRGDWPRAAALAGVHLIDPRAPVQQVLEEIADCEMLLAEAMHGAIVADALRVPWIALRPLDPIHRFKWQDWAEPLDLPLRPQALAASTLRERIEVIRIGRRVPGRRVTRLLPGLAGIGADAFAESAAEALRRAAASEACLSRDAMLDRAVTRLQEAIERFRQDQPIAAR
jgi:succinoglycan biosynthesis protein ExoV